MLRVRRPLALASLLAIAAVLAACTDGGEGGTATTTTAAPAATATTAGPGTTSSTTSSTTSVDESPAPEIELRGDGLGVVDLGAAPEVAIAAVSDELGEPTRDTGWDSASSSYGTCPGERVRGVEWDHLALLFTDGTTPYGRGEHFFAWRVSGAPPALGTAKGLGFGATVADAEELYPGEVEVTEADEPFPGFLTVPVGDGTITGYLEGEVITNLEAGASCGE